MNEPLAPHGFYDGPVKELATRHLALIKAVFILLLVSVPGCLFIASLDRLRGYKVERVKQTSYGSRVVDLDNVEEYVYSWSSGVHSWSRDVYSWSFGVKYDENTDKIIAYNYGGFRGLSKGWFETLPMVYCLLACGFALHGFGLLFYRFFRLAKLLYPHMVFYFTALVLVPFLNVVVIFLLLRSALQQMRQMGLRVGVFGIDPARFD